MSPVALRAPVLSERSGPRCCDARYHAAYLAAVGTKRERLDHALAHVINVSCEGHAAQIGEPCDANEGEWPTGGKSAEAIPA